ncbi:MAG: toll/interleukin-1 receptor domain-containing protein [Candidatus Bathyarchaeota archaeon]|nr:toll/interleukin-1 receptor domain-containing protein [Candidatus Bathyarchaeota archaeon]
MPFKVFISASMKDRAIVQELKSTIVKYGITAMSVDEMPANENVEHYIRNQIWSTDCFLAIIGNDSTQSRNVDLEMGMAVSYNKVIVPIVEEGASIPRSIASRQFILIDKDNPRLSYERAANYLNQLKMEQDKRNSIGGLVLLGLGILLLGALASSSE